LLITIISLSGCVQKASETVVQEPEITEEAAIFEEDISEPVLPVQEPEITEETIISEEDGFELVLPVKKDEVVFDLMGIWPFGVKGGDHPLGHPGIDIEAKAGTPVRAMGGGSLGKPGISGHYDYETLSIFHENNFETYYTGNMRDFTFETGGRVKAGDIIAYYDKDESIHYGLQRKEPYESVCPVDYLSESARADLEELFLKAHYQEKDEFPLLCNPCPEGGCR